QNQLDCLVVGNLAGVADEALLVGLAPNRVEVQTRAVVTDFDQYLRAFPAQFELDLPGRRLAGLQPLLRLLETMHYRITEKVLERRKHAVENLPVDLAAAAFDDQLGRLAGFACRLANDAGKPRDVTLERHHASLHEPFL